jgi:hypothetical protein
MISDRCPLCGASTDIVCGVRLPRLKAAILRAIKAAGDIGIGSVELLDAVYPERGKPRRETIKVHVGQINELLVETDFRIVSVGRRWILQRAAA